MKTIEQVSREIEQAIETLERRHDSSADDAEKRVILSVIEALNGELKLLKRAESLQAAASIATANAALEQAVAAARLGPFDGHLCALEGSLMRLDRLSGKLHAPDRLKGAAERAPRATRSKARKKVKSAQAPRAAASLELPGTQLLTSTTFTDLKDEYQSCFDRCTMRDESAGNVAYYLKRLKRGQPNYELVEREIGVPWMFIGIIHAMECGFNFSGHVHNGDPLSARTVQVPKGYPKTGTPPFTWLQSALDAMRLKKLDQVSDWSVPHMLYLLEGYNGFGYRRRGLASPYLWSFSNIYDKGKFVQDGKFDPNAVSKQCGAGLMLKSVLSS